MYLSGKNRHAGGGAIELCEPLQTLKNEHGPLMAHLIDEVKGNEAKALADLITQAYFILTDHFSKEENVLFPMAEQMRSEEEKEELHRKIMTL